QRSSPLPAPTSLGGPPAVGTRTMRALPQSPHTGPPHIGQGWLAIGASRARASRSARHWSHSPCSGGVEMNAAPQRWHDHEVLKVFIAVCPVLVVGRGAPASWLRHPV